MSEKQQWHDCICQENKRIRTAFDHDGRADDSADDTAIPDQASTGEQHRKRIGYELAPMLKNKVEPCTDNPADDRGDADVAGQLGVDIAADEIFADEVDRDQKTQHEHHAKAVDRQGANDGDIFNF